MGDAIGHALHDLFAITAAVDGGRSPASAVPAANCRTCAALQADLVAIRSAIRAAAIPTRPRDYALSERDAARLRPRVWRDLLVAIGTARDALTRPLALSFTGLGIAGLLIGAVPGALPAVGGAGASMGPAAAPRIEALHAEPPAAPTSTSVPGSGSVGGVSPVDRNQAMDAVDTLDPSPLTVLSLGLLGVGGGLFGARRLAARSGTVR